MGTPLGILGLLAAGEERSNPVQCKVGVSSQAICLPNNVAVPEERLGEPGHLPLQSSSSLKLPLGQLAIPCAQGSTEVRQGSWVPQGQRCSPRTQSECHGQGVGMRREGQGGEGGSTALIGTGRMERILSSPQHWGGLQADPSRGGRAAGCLESRGTCTLAAS